MEIDERIEKLRRIEQEADIIRREFAISPRGAVIYRGEMDLIGDKVAVVEADGFGAAMTKVITGNYPIDYITHFEKAFRTEDEAVAAADAICLGGPSPDCGLSDQN